MLSARQLLLPLYGVLLEASTDHLILVVNEAVTLTEKLNMACCACVLASRNVVGDLEGGRSRRVG